MSEEAARDAAERVARESYGRLVAILSSRSRDIAGAEDALADALVAALASWPSGMPQNPDAWLLTAARNRIKNAARSRTVADAAMPDLLRLQEERSEEDGAFPDDRLKLMFVCAHPAIDVAIRTPLMLQTILGLDAARIASAFLVAPATMGQRLARAKAKIRAAGLRFELPAGDELQSRLAEVLEAIYAAFGVGWDDAPGQERSPRGLDAEAIHLCRILVGLLPGEAEPKGLLALMLFCDARRDARRDENGQFVPLAQQDARLWRRDLIIEAEGLLTSASKLRHFGRFQCEAAIQSVHVQRPLTGVTNLDALLALYRLLVERHRGVGACVGLAAVLIDKGRAAEALSVLDEISDGALVSYQPYWVTRAKALNALNRQAEADAALRKAIEMTTDEAVRVFLLRHLNSAQG